MLKLSRQKYLGRGSKCSVLIGNMNVGKETFFNALCHSYTGKFESNESSTSYTLGKIKGVDRLAVLTPGTTSLFSENEDEKVSRNILLSTNDKFNIDSIVLVADAKNLKRSILLFLQYAEYGLPSLFVLNMVDEMNKKGIDIDTDILKQILGVDVLTTIACERIGVTDITLKLSDLNRAKKLISYPDWIIEFDQKIKELLPSINNITFAHSLLLLTGDNDTLKNIKKSCSESVFTKIISLIETYQKNSNKKIDLLLTELYNKKADEIVRLVQTERKKNEIGIFEKLGDLCSSIWFGVPFAALVVYMMYLFVGEFGATFVVDLINQSLFEERIIPFTTDLVNTFNVPFISELLLDPDFGVLPTGVFLAVGLVFPVLFCFYTFFGFLEDSGYISRISVLLDRSMKLIGLNGKGIIPIVMGFSCITMAILTTRILKTEKEKNIATFLLILGVPCAPLIGVVFIILGRMPLSATIFYFGVLFTQITIAGMLANKILKGKTTPLLMEIPPLKFPNPVPIVQKSFRRSMHFLKEAIPVFIMASVVLFLFNKIGGLTLIENAMRPLTVEFMGLPEKSVQVFIKTMIRRESGATELMHIKEFYSNKQLLLNLLVMTFLMPCVNAIIVIFKERGTKPAISIITFVLVYALLMGGILNKMLTFFKITFS